jgi:hypothetical protein
MPYFRKHVVVFSLKHKLFLSVDGFVDDELKAKRFDTEEEALHWLFDVMAELTYIDIGHFHTRTFYTVS